MRIIVAQINQESHSFTTVPGTLQSFKDCMFYEGNDIGSKLRGINSEIAGFIDVAEEEKLEPVYTIATRAVTSGPITEEAFSCILNRLLEGVQAAGTTDGIYLALHGATLLGEADDATGLVLEAVRKLVGPSFPIVASLDMHANVTKMIVENADALVGYRTFPHTDFREVGEKATRILLKVIRKEISPNIGFCKIGMIIPPEAAQTYREPALKLIRKIEEIETDQAVVTAFYCAVQPWYDAPDVGCSAVVVTDGRKDIASNRSKEIAELFWSLRRDFEPRLFKVDEAIEKAKRTKGLVVFLDSADGTSSGSAGDNTEILEAFLRTETVGPLFTTIVDRDAVKVAGVAGVGSHISLSLGGKIDLNFSGRPVEVRAEVLKICDGIFRNEGEIMHGAEMSMGQVAVLRVGPVSIVVMEKPTMLWDPQVYRSVGLEPKNAKIVVVKSPVAAYKDIAREMMFVDTLGASSPHLNRLPYARAKHPLYPFEDVKRIECV